MGNHGVQYVQNIHRFRPISLSFDLEHRKHKIFDVFLSCFIAFVISLVLPSPVDEILFNLFLHIIHLKSRGADGDGREADVGHWFGSALQRGHHLARWNQSRSKQSPVQIQNVLCHFYCNVIRIRKSRPAHLSTESRCSR